MERLGKYEIVAKIGVGGFGVVYKGVDPFIKRPVAIKTCSAEDLETRERFLREAEIAGNLQHRNIVTIFEFGFHEETPYLVQEFLSGEDLDHKIKRGDAVPVSTKISWLVEIARGLSFAHANGVVHRDIKPANIRVLADGHVKILDFGIAKLAKAQSDLTQAGVTLGTASYLAPEQIRGEPVDPRTDVFSFGVLAYELLTYEKPFRAQEISALFYKLLNEKPAPLGERSPGAPAGLVEVVDRCLAKEPVRRFSPTSDLLRALERLEPRPISTGIVPRPPTVERTRAVDVDPKTERLPARPRSLASDPTVELGQLELHGAPDEARPESRGMAPAASSIGGRMALVGGAVAIAALALAIGWFGSAGGDAEAPESGPVTAPATAPTAPAPAPTAAEATPTAAEVPPALPPGPSADAQSEVAPSEATPGVQEEPTVEAELPPPPPPPPAPARLVIGPAWDPAMTVRVGGRRVRLDREQTIEVPAGVVVLEFSLVRPEYSADEPLRLQLKPGAREPVSIPIEPPGRLTVQPHLNARPGHLRLDGQAIGTSPIRGRWVAPGEHFLEIYAAPEDADPTWTRSLSIVSRTETVVTFDLDGGAETLVRERPADTP